MNSDDLALHDLAAPYALDALDPDERRAYEAHLTECSDCPDLVAAFRESAAAIALGAAEPLPPQMRDRVLLAIDQTPQDRSVVGIGVRRRPGMTARLLIAAAALVVLVAGIAGMLSIGGGSLSAADVLAAADLVSVNLDATADYAGPPALATVSFSPGEAAAVVTFAALAPVGPDQTYELWVIDDAEPKAAGIFRPDATGRAQLLVAEPVAPGDIIAVTLEPAGGVEVPTGAVLFAGSV